jgi:chemotaxis methyl-accepting protein methylase
VTKRIWDHLPATIRRLAPGRWYGRHVHGLVGRLAERTQSHGTFFLRNRPELELLRRLVDVKANGTSLEVSVFACSKGAEVYSIAWTIRSARPDLKLRLHAFDISQEIVEFAKIGAYSLRRPPTLSVVSHQGASEEDKLSWNTYRDQGANQDLSVFERMTEDEIKAMFDREGDHLRVKPMLKEAIIWHTGDAGDPELASILCPQDILVANRFLCHMKPVAAERCLRNLARLVKPGGYLFVSGVDLDVRQVVGAEMKWEPVTELLEEIYEGDASLINGWPLEWWGQEPFQAKRPDWSTRYASVFQLRGAPRQGGPTGA